MAAWRTRAVGPKSGGDEISSLMTSQESSSWQNSKESHDDLKKEQKNILHASIRQKFWVRVSREHWESN